MPNYQNGKIYAIRSHSRPDLIYVGSSRAKSILYLVGKEEVCDKIES